MASLIYPAPETATSTRENNDTASICGTGVRAKSRFVTAQRCHSCYLLCGRSFPGSALNRSAVTPSGTLIHKFHPAAVPCCPVAGVSISRGGREFLSCQNGFTYERVELDSRPTCRLPVTGHRLCLRYSTDAAVRLSAVTRSCDS